MPNVIIDLYIPHANCPCSPARNDPKADRFNALLLDLKEQRPGLAYRVFALNTHFAMFKANPRVAAVLRDEGHDALPLVFVEGELRFKGAYPTREELEAALNGHGDSGQPGRKSL
jgi:hypothetical protein